MTKPTRDALTVLSAVEQRETAAGSVTVGELAAATELPPMVVVNELERFIRGGMITGRLQKLLSGGDPSPWFLVNPLISEGGRALLISEPSGIGTLREHAGGHSWDAFISHAHEDKAEFVDALARELELRGLSIWYDEKVLEVGDSVRRAIDEGLAASDFGVVVISPDFMRKDWTNRELDGILVRERGGKRLLPIWHKVDFEQVQDYSPTVAGRFAVRSAIGVAGVADALCRAMKRGDLSDDASHPADATPGPQFLAQLNAMANARLYTWVVVAPASEIDSRFSDEVIDTMTSWIGALEPRAVTRQAGSSYIWLNVLDASSTAVWSAEAHPGPVLTLMTELSPREIDPAVGHAISFEGLVGWWAKVIGALPTLAGNLGWDRVRLGLGLNPYGSSGTRVVALDFRGAPAPKRRAAPHQIPPWNAHLAPFDPFDIPPSLLQEPIRDLLDSLSYGRVDETLAWVAASLVAGTLEADYQPPALDH